MNILLDFKRAESKLSPQGEAVPRYDKPVLIEGGNYAGIWMECGPHEVLMYPKLRPDVSQQSPGLRRLQRPEDSAPRITRCPRQPSDRFRWWGP